MASPHPAPTVDLAGPWQQARPGLFVFSGPAPLDAEALHHWLDRGCRGTVPVRQGFAAALLRADGSAVIASSSRWEQSVLHAAAAGRTVVGIHAADVIRRLPQPPALDLAKLADLVALYDDA
ncbi:hypothetical protein, partial [Nocardioides stalactiti]|uniref:hypothetical protein n=1 Tax=Nocardioides stalactiti TaxID=2755356 RepID=UPI001603EAAB